jgi:hypothetical protein
VENVATNNNRVVKIKYITFANIPSQSKDIATEKFLFARIKFTIAMQTIVAFLSTKLLPDSNKLIIYSLEAYNITNLSYVTISIQ